MKAIRVTTVAVLVLMVASLVFGTACGSVGLTGPKGDTGATGATGPEGPAGVSYSPMKIALLRWYDANLSGVALATGSNPYGICFDGANIWVANSTSNNVSKL